MALQIVAYIATAVVFLGLDATWLTAMADRLYRPTIGALMLEKFSLPPAILFYALYILGVMIFAVWPAITSGRWMLALTNGAMFGFFAYATYDLTNQATLRNWSTLLSVADIVWGSIVTGVSATLGCLIAMQVAKWIGAAAH